MSTRAATASADVAGGASDAAEDSIAAPPLTVSTAGLAGCSTSEETVTHLLGILALWLLCVAFYMRRRKLRRQK